MKVRSIAKLSLSLSKFQGIIPVIPKTKTAKVNSQRTGQSYTYMYADLADIWEAIRKPLSENELAILQIFETLEGKPYLVTILAHSSGEWVESCLELDSHEKIQELGSEITYYRRYALSSILGIVTDQDEDGQIANEASKKKSREPENIIKEKQNVIEAAQPMTLNKEQIENIRSLISDYPEIVKDVTKSFGKSYIKDIEYSKYNQVLAMIQMLLKQEGVA